MAGENKISLTRGFYRKYYPFSGEDNSYKDIWIHFPITYMQSGNDKKLYEKSLTFYQSKKPQNTSDIRTDMINTITKIINDRVAEINKINVVELAEEMNFSSLYGILPPIITSISSNQGKASLSKIKNPTTLKGIGSKTSNTNNDVMRDAAGNYTLNLSKLFNEIKDTGVNKENIEAFFSNNKTPEEKIQFGNRKLTLNEFTQDVVSAITIKTRFDKSKQNIEKTLKADPINISNTKSDVINNNISTIIRYINDNNQIDKDFSEAAGSVPEFISQNRGISLNYVGDFYSEALSQNIITAINKYIKNNINTLNEKLGLKIMEKASDYMKNFNVTIVGQNIGSNNKQGKPDIKVKNSAQTLIFTDKLLVNITDIENSIKKINSAIKEAKKINKQSNKTSEKLKRDKEELMAKKRALTSRLNKEISKMEKDLNRKITQQYSLKNSMLASSKMLDSEKYSAYIQSNLTTGKADMEKYLYYNMLIEREENNKGHSKSESLSSLFTKKKQLEIIEANFIIKGIQKILEDMISKYIDEGVTALVARNGNIPTPILTLHYFRNLIIELNNSFGATLNSDSIDKYLNKFNKELAENSHSREAAMDLANAIISSCCGNDIETRNYYISLIRKQYKSLDTLLKIKDDNKKSGLDFFINIELEQNFYNILNKNNLSMVDYYNMMSALDSAKVQVSSIKGR